MTTEVTETRRRRERDRQSFLTGFEIKMRSRHYCLLLLSNVSPRHGKSCEVADRMNKMHRMKPQHPVIPVNPVRFLSPSVPPCLRGKPRIYIMEGTIRWRKHPAVQPRLLKNDIQDGLGHHWPAVILQ